MSQMPSVRKDRDADTRRPPTDLVIFAVACSGFSIGLICGAAFALANSFGG